MDSFGLAEKILIGLVGVAVFLYTILRVLMHYKRYSRARDTMTRNLSEMDEQMRAYFQKEAPGSDVGMEKFREMVHESVVEELAEQKAERDNPTSPRDLGPLKKRFLG